MDLRMDAQRMQSAVPRATTTALAEKPVTPSLGEVWPEVAARLKAMLRHRGVDPATAEDVTQETAVRVLRHRVAFVDADDLFRWGSIVAWRLAIDARRKAARLDVGPLPERQSNFNVALAVEHRSALEAVGRGLEEMSEADRGAILGSLHNEHHPGDRPQAAAAAVRRHRARRRLLAATKGFLAVLGWLALRRRQGVSRPAVAAAAATPVLIVALALAPQMQAGADDAPAAAPLPAGPAAVEPRSPAPAVDTVAPPSVATAQPHGEPSSRAATTTTTMTPQGVLPPLHVEVADPAGGRTEAGGRPERPGDRTLCVELPEDRTCVDVPVDTPVTLF